MSVLAAAIPLGPPTLLQRGCSTLQGVVMKEILFVPRPLAEPDTKFFNLNGFIINLSRNRHLGKAVFPGFTRLSTKKSGFSKARIGTPIGRVADPDLFGRIRSRIRNISPNPDPDPIGTLAM